MRKPQPVESDDGGGLDSLLDTMTNVVGILVMMLIATQLGVKEAVDRISDATLTDPKVVAAAQEKLEMTKAERDAIEQKLNDLKPVDEISITVQLADLRRQLDTAQATLNAEEQRANQFALKIEDDKKKAEAAKKQIADMKVLKAKRDEMSEQITAALEDEARLKALLDTTVRQKAPPPKIVTMPDPRPAPEGAQGVVFLCAFNKVYPIADDSWRDTVKKRGERIVEFKRLYGGPDVGVDKEKFLAEMEKTSRTLRDDFFQLEVYASGIYPRIRFIPREESGATIKEVLTPRSRFQRMIASVDRSKYYARFMVMPDSFEAYLAARAVADRAGLLSGWEPQPDTWQFTTHIGGKVLFGPKPKPNPNAKPKPPSKPANVID